MRVVIAVLLVAAFGTSILAYGPKVSFMEPRDRSDEEAVSPDSASTELSTPEPEPSIDPMSVPPGEVIPGTDGLRRVSGSIQRSINHTLADKLDRSVADPLTQVVSRVLVWWMNPHRDLQRGDRLSIVYSLHDGEEPRLHGVSMTSQRHGRTFRAYSFHPADSAFRRVYTEDGNEVEKRLVGSPIEDYEQITSLLWDGRGHNGVDFKTPVGTKAHAPFDGRVSRRNWSTRFNGNCIEIVADDGTRVIFLHLDSFAEGMTPGRRVQKGELVALSGNTGRSTAPHLHYELRTASDRVLDPFDVHQTYRKKLPKEEMEEFEEHVAMLRALLEPADAYAADR